MKKLQLILALSFPLAFCACSNNDEFENLPEKFTRAQYSEEITSSSCFDLPIPTDRYKYPVLPGCPEWLELHNMGMDAVMKSLEIPDNVLSDMSSESLLLTYLDYPYSGDYIFSSSTVYKGFLACLGCENDSKIFKQMKKRSSMSDTLLKYYKSFNANPNYETNWKVWTLLNLFCSLDEFLDDLSSKQKKELVRLGFEKMDLVNEKMGECSTSEILFMMARVMWSDDYSPFVKKVKSDKRMRDFLETEFDDISLYQYNVIPFAKEYSGL